MSGPERSDREETSRRPNGTRVAQAVLAMIPIALVLGSLLMLVIVAARPMLRGWLLAALGLAAAAVGGYFSYNLIWANLGRTG